MNTDQEITKDPLANEITSLTEQYYLLARELARHDLVRAQAVTGLPRSFLERLRETTGRDVRHIVACAVGVVTFTPRFPVPYWQQVVESIGRTAPDSLTALYASALCVRSPTVSGHE